MKNIDYTKSTTTKDLVKCLTALGHKVVLNKHYKAYNKSGQGLVTFSATPSCVFAVKKVIADLKRNGF